MAPAPRKSKAGAQNREASPAPRGAKKGGRVSNTRKKKVDSEAEDIDEDSDPNEEDAGEREETQDPVSTADLAAVLRKFTEGRSKKEAAAAKAVEKQIFDMLDAGEKRVGELIKSRTTKFQATRTAFEKTLDRPLKGPTPQDFTQAVNELRQAAQRACDASKKLRVGLDPEKIAFFTEASSSLKQRPIKGRKAHRKFMKALRREQEDQATMQQLNAENGPFIVQQMKSMRLEMGRPAEVQRKLLEQLMGAEAMGIVQLDISLWDPKVCRPFVTGICPHDLFTNTKMDLGVCARTHSVKLKNEYAELMKKAEAEDDKQKIAELNRLKADYESTIFAFVDECDRRIRAAQRRLEKTPEENNRTTNLMREIGEIEGAYQAAMAQVEELGSQGKVDESIAELAKAEALKGEKQEKERELQNLTETSGASGHQKLRVCDICGAYLSILDSDRRLADHFGGKMHLGYLQLRQLMDEWRARGPLPTAPAPPMNGSMPPPGASSAPRPLEAAPPVAFRPIPTSSAPPSGNGHGSPPRDSRDRDHRSSRGHDESSRGSSSRDHRSSSSRYDDRDSHRSSRRHDDDDDRRHSSRRDEERRSSRRGHEDEDRGDKEKRRRLD